MVLAFQITLQNIAILLVMVLIFIVLVLRAVYMISIAKRDPINAISLHPSEWKILKWDKDKVDKKVRSIMS